MLSSPPPTTIFWSKTWEYSCSCSCISKSARVKKKKKVDLVGVKVEFSNLPQNFPLQTAHPQILVSLF